MKHAGGAALDELEPLLDALRQLDVLSERKRGNFVYRSRAFLHFHEDPAGLFADVRLGDDFERREVTTEPQRRAFLEAVRSYVEG